ncbi:MAG: 1-aminocyclopropane-1-carboxylate deaminase/D-cysteine desulfhydrase [Chitinophagaceae bacterium]
MLKETIPFTSIFSGSVPLQRLHNPLWEDQQIGLTVFRADLIHPLISGNKWYKLQYYIKDCLATGKSGLITMGGAYSNHLLATAATAHHYQLRSMAFVRGEESSTDSPTLADCRRLGMQLRFIDRPSYRQEGYLLKLAAEWAPDHTWIPEGGNSDTGIAGAQDMLKDIDLPAYSHVCCAIGSGTTFTGLSRAIEAHQEIIGVSALKIPEPSAWLNHLLELPSRGSQNILTHFHQGGFARYDQELLSFMNDFYHRYQIATDFVYTAKLFRAVFQQLKEGAIPRNSELLCIHSGGLQGNRSLPAGSLAF